MKKTKRMLISALLVFTLCMLTACGNNNNAADEVPNTANDGIDNVGDGAAEDNLTDDADTMMETTEQTVTWLAIQQYRMMQTPQMTALQFLVTM